MIYATTWIIKEKKINKVSFYRILLSQIPAYNNDHGNISFLLWHWTSQVALVVKNLPANAGDARHMSSIPGSGRSSGVGNGNPLQYSCLENPKTGETWGLESTGL